jgi:hypothetical protein
MWNYLRPISRTFQVCPQYIWISFIRHGRPAAIQRNAVSFSSFRSICSLSEYNSAIH